MKSRESRAFRARAIFEQFLVEKELKLTPDPLYPIIWGIKMKLQTSPTILT